MNSRADEATATDGADRPREPAWFAGAWLACGAVVVGLLLPWSGNDAYTRDAFGRAGVASAIGLVIVAGTVVLLALYRAGAVRSVPVALRVLTGVGGFVGVITAAVYAGADVSGVGQHDGRAAGPLAFSAALIALAVLSFRLERMPTTRRVTDRTSLVVTAAGVVGSGLALVGLLAPWERLSSSALEPIVAAPSVVFLGPELPATQALRWTLLALAALAVVTAAVPITRTIAFPAVVAVGGIVVVVLSAPRALTSDLVGVNATLTSGYGPWFCAAGGFVAASGGLLGIAAAVHGSGRGRTDGRIGGAAAAATVLVVSLGGGVHAAPLARADGANEASKVLLDKGRHYVPQRLGGRAVDGVDVGPALGADSTLGYQAPDVLATSAGTFFTTPDFDRDGSSSEKVLINQVVDGRVLPVTVVFGADYAYLLAVVGHRALVQVRVNARDTVRSVDLTVGMSNAYGTARPGPPRGGEPGTLLTTTGDNDRSGDLPAGYIGGNEITTSIGPDGAALVRSLTRGTFRVSAADVRSGRPWPLRSVGQVDVPGLDASAYSSRHDPYAVVRTSSTGRQTVVAGGASDARCTLSRDPLSSTFTDTPVSVQPTRTAVDRAGDLWLVSVPYTSREASQVLVLTPDGVLRRLERQRWAHATGVQAMPDGSLFLTTKAASSPSTSLYRFPVAAAAARAAAPLPSVAADCVSDNRVALRTAGLRATRTDLGTAAMPGGTRFPSNVVTDARGDRIVADYDATTQRTTLYRLTVDGTRTTIRPGSTAAVDDLVADGRGGAWFTEPAADDRPGALVHVDAAGRTRRSPGVVRDAPVGDNRGLIADAGDGSVWFPGAGTAWNRTTLTGTTSRLGFTGDDVILAVRNGRGYVVHDKVIKSLTTARVGPVVIGGGSLSLALPSAVVSKAPLSNFSVSGNIAVALDGSLLLHQGDYLARFPVGGGRPVVLSGPRDGLPSSLNAADLSADGGRVALYDGTTRWTVDLP